MIKFDRVTKKFGSIIALEEVTFEISGGEFVFLTGPSGAGKTTLIKLLLREILPTSGEIEVDDFLLSKMPPGKVPQLRRNLGVVFQDFKLLQDRTVYENVAIALQILKLSEKDIKERVDGVLDLVGLTDRAGLFPSQLAGGELQRACLARAVVGKPKVLMADEPTGNLDPATSWQITKLIKAVNKSGTTVLMATHNVDIVNSLSERVIEMKKGKVVRDVRKGKYQE